MRVIFYKRYCIIYDLVDFLKFLEKSRLKIKFDLKLKDNIEFIYGRKGIRSSLLVGKFFNIN